MSSQGADIGREVYRETGRKLIGEAIDRAAGREAEHCDGARPSRRYFISNLSPRQDVDEEGEETDEDGPFTESEPSMIGMRCRPARGQDSLHMSVSFSVFVRRIPTWQEYTELNGERDEFNLKTKFFDKRRVELDTALDMSEPVDDLAEQITDELQSRVQETFAEVVDEQVVYPSVALGRIDTLDEGTLTGSPDEAEYREALEIIDDHDPVEHPWRVEVTIQQQDREDGLPEFDIELSNQTVVGNDSLDCHLFNPEIRLEGEFGTYTFQRVASDYRYNRSLWAKGLNCSVATEGLSTEDGEYVGAISTEAVPTYQQPAHVWTDTEDIPEAVFGRLDSADTIDNLSVVREAMVDYKARWMGQLREQVSEELNLNETELEEYDAGAERFDEEMENFEAGIDVLDSHPEAERAFRLMNRAFERQYEGNENVDGWRAFQLVFIVSNIPSIVGREDPSLETRLDEAEVLWFPTGGGKTEAYLGLIVFNLFYDRIRGKERGVTAWIRFPLTLLGKQQKSRFLDSMLHAERLRQEEDLGGERFELGYLVGGETTPNQISDNGRSNNYYNDFTDQRKLEEECREIDECPYCEGEEGVALRHDRETNRVYHRCRNNNCPFDDLPIYVTDYEIYRYIPSVLLGTLDRIAITGINRRFTNLLGNLTSRCPVHGYGYSGKCAEANTVGCEEEVERVPEEELPDDPIPTLHLVDEVHLLSEELGVFAGHYETLYMRLCEWSDEQQPKVITSSATISDKEGLTDQPSYAEHIENIFLLDANRFPEDGPKRDESFYRSVREDELQREYIGIAPNNKTHIYAVLDLVKRLHEVIRDAYAAPEEYDLDTSHAAEVLRMYDLSVVYFLRKTEKDRYMRSMRNQIAREMEDDGYGDDGYDSSSEVIVDQLTADKDNRELLESLEHPTQSFQEGRTENIAATSFIGHGIDVSRFNFMFFFGFPMQTFQYIQTSSRVGREVPGFAIDIFKPWDRRDRHRYKYFEKSHEYLDRTVEDISIDRYSQFSLDRTFPGIFAGILRQYFRPVMALRHGMNVESSRELMEILDADDAYSEFTMDRFESMLKAAYGIGPEHPRSQAFAEPIENRLEDYWGFWTNHLLKEYYTRLPVDEEPMRSLRDIGEDGSIGIEDDEHRYYRQLISGE